MLRYTLRSESGCARTAHNSTLQRQLRHWQPALRTVAEVHSDFPNASYYHYYYYIIIVIFEDIYPKSEHPSTEVSVCANNGVRLSAEWTNTDIYCYFEVTGSDTVCNLVLD
jgi:hypothetical protein